MKILKDEKKRKKIWYYAFPIRHIYEWYRELTHIRIENGEPKFRRSFTQCFRSALALIVLGGVYLVVDSIYYKLYGSNAEVRNSLDAPVLGVITGAVTGFATLLTLLQKSYTEHKQKITENYNKYRGKDKNPESDSYASSESDYESDYDQK